MTWSLKHKFHSAKTDGPDSTLIKPTNWNDDHDFTSSTDGVVIGRPAGAGAGAFQEVPMMGLVAPGFIAPFAGSTIPAGWYEMYGQTKNRLTDAALFAAIGTTYGAGDGSTTFNLPDARGTALAGFTAMGGTDRGNLPGGGVMGAQLGSGANRQPRHYGNVDSGTVTVSGTLHGTVDSNAPPDTFQTGPGGEHTVCAAFAANTLSVQANGSLTGSGVGGIRNDGANVTDAFSVIQPTLIVRWLIKA